MEREWVRVFVVDVDDDEGAAFAVFHQIVAVRDRIDVTDATDFEKPNSNW